MPLSEIITGKIRNEGPLSFHDFMEMALYYPELGYYSSMDRRPETTGEHHHNPELSSVIGALLARQLEEMWKVLDKKSFTLVEYGAGPANFCRAIFSHFRNLPELYEHLHYCIIEKSGAVMQRQKQQLCEEAEWFNSIEEVPYPPDCILSNEVVNNFAVHEVVMQKELMEVFVDYKDGFTEILKPAPPELKEYLREMNVVLPPGYRTEINMEALQWLRKNAAALQKGFMLTIDYGFPADEFFSLSRHRGNLLCLDEKKDPEILYHAAGEKDIKAHVNFTALHHWGRKLGLECCGYTSQAHFLHGLGLLPALDHIHNDNEPSCKERIVQLYRKIMRISSRFNILVQQKGLHEPQLSGLHFAKNYV
jgi:SAM-dependent MidA family methyltransferase